jgi:hypothetical protein
MDVVAPAPEAKVVPRLDTCERDPWREPVVASDPAFVQGSVVVGPESLEEAVGVPLAEVGSVSELVPVEMVDTGRDEYVPEDIEWYYQPLNEVIDRSSSSIGAVVEEARKRSPHRSCVCKFIYEVRDAPRVPTRQGRSWARRDLEIMNFDIKSVRSANPASGWDWAG